MKISYKYLSLAMGMVSFLMLAPSVSAQSKGNYGWHRAARPAVKQTPGTASLEPIKMVGSKEIDGRVASLNKLSMMIQGMKNLSADQKSAFLNDINSNITNLNNLKAKLNSDTDIETAKADRRSIFDTYRIYAVFFPRETIMAQGDAILARINALKVKVTNANALSKLADATDQVNSAITTVSGLTPEGYPGNAAVIKTARGQLKTAVADMMAARKLMHQK